LIESGYRNTPEVISKLLGRMKKIPADNADSADKIGENQRNLREFSFRSHLYQ